MLNIGKLAVNGGEYYLEVVASGVEDYYLGAGEAPGWWTGNAAAQLGLSGRVNASDLEAVLAGTHPRTGDKLLRGFGGPRLPGFDLTFRAPKSVSLLWALSTPDVAEDVRACHDRAVATALEFLERHAIGTRRGTNGVEHVEADGAVAAVFRHRTSRAGDPLLHSHVLVANLAHTTDDDRWRTLNGRLLYTHSKTAGFVYQAALRHELTSTLGVAWQPVVNGTADLQGVPREVIEHFSRRRADILAALDATGHSSAKAAQVATLTTRQRKEYGVSAATLTDRWTARAQAVDLGPDRVDQLLFNEPRRELDDIDVDAVLANLAGPAGLTEYTSTFTRRDVIRAWCERLPRGGRLDLLERLADQTLADSTGVAVRLNGRDAKDPSESPEVDRVLAALSEGAGRATDQCQPLRAIVTSILGQSESTPDKLADALLAERLNDARDVLGVLTWRARKHARKAGVALDQTGATPVAAPRHSHREARYSTPDLLVTERQALHNADQAVAMVNCDPGFVDAALAASRLSDEQRVMVRQITTGREGVQIVVGRAGAGKTTALSEAVPLWRVAGCTVTGAALAARTAKQLGDETGITSTTLERLLHGLDATPPRHTDVILVDEAAMVGTRQLARLIARTTAAGARLVLVGDHHQLPEINAGGLFRALTAQPHSVELRTNRRQHDPAERTAVDAIRDGNHDLAVAHFAHPVRHTTHETSEEAFSAVVEGWWTDLETGLDSTMLAAHNDQVDRLNEFARDLLDAAGRLYGPELRVGGHGYRVGDLIVCRRNDRRLGVVNGTIATIDAIDAKDEHIHATTAIGTAIELPREFTADRGISPAYATTVHMSQGRTLDTAHALYGDTDSQELVYVMLSRHRHRVYLHTCREPASGPRAELTRRANVDDTPPLTAALGRTLAKRMAQPSLDPGPAPTP